MKLLIFVTTDDPRTCLVKGLTPLFSVAEKPDVLYCGQCQNHRAAAGAVSGFCVTDRYRTRTNISLQR